MATPEMYLAVTIQDRTEESVRIYRVLPADMMRAERAGVAKDSIEFAFRLAYSAAKRAGQAGDDFDAWADTVLLVEESTSPKAQAPNS